MGDNQVDSIMLDYLKRNPEVLRLSERLPLKGRCHIMSKQDPLTGIINRVLLHCTDTDIVEYRLSGARIQDVFSDMNPDEREFIISGIIPQSWDQLVV